MPLPPPSLTLNSCTRVALVTLCAPLDVAGRARCVSVSETLTALLLFVLGAADTATLAEELGNRAASGRDNSLRATICIWVACRGVEMK